jgi:hypothetical protein
MYGPQAEVGQVRVGTGVSRVLHFWGKAILVEEECLSPNYQYETTHGNPHPNCNLDVGSKLLLSGTTI